MKYCISAALVSKIAYLYFVRHTKKDDYHRAQLISFVLLTNEAARKSSVSLRELFLVSSIFGVNISEVFIVPALILNYTNPLGFLFKLIGFTYMIRLDRSKESLIKAIVTICFLTYNEQPISLTLVPFFIELLNAPRVATFIIYPVLFPAESSESYANNLTCIIAIILLLFGP